MLPPRYVPTRKELPYTKIKELGRGTFGKVLEVKNQGGRHFALKVMHTTRNSYGPRLGALQEEVRTIQVLQNHHHFIKVRDAYQGDREVGFIYEPVADRGSLESCIVIFLQRQGPAPELQYIFDRAFGCLVSGLKFMHDNHIRHKDIKPANILVHQGRVICESDLISNCRGIYTDLRSGDCDFGLSVDSAGAPDSTTRGPLTTGTTKYMAPEVQASEPRNSTSDTFALGCVFLELLYASALSQWIYENNFSEAMLRLHEDLNRHRSRLGAQSFLVDHILGMTAHDHRARPEATTLALAICNRPGFCCEQCATYEIVSASSSELPAVMNETEPYWKWSQQDQKHYHRDVDSYGTLMKAPTYLSFNETDQALGRSTYTWSQ
jgi:serine/threonine protein kinase